MSNWFSRCIVLTIDLKSLEVRSKKGSASYAPFIEITSKGIVASVGQAQPVSSSNTLANIFTDTNEQLSIPLNQSFFKHIISLHANQLLRPKVLLKTTKAFVDEYGFHTPENIAMMICCSFQAEMFLCNLDDKPIGYFSLAPRGAFIVKAIPATQTQRALDHFKDLLGRN